MSNVLINSGNYTSYKNKIITSDTDVVINLDNATFNVPFITYLYYNGKNDATLTIKYNYTNLKVHKISKNSNNKVYMINIKEKKNSITSIIISYIDKEKFNNKIELFYDDSYCKWFIYFIIILLVFNNLNYIRNKKI
jgi:hypothetical protein